MRPQLIRLAPGFIALALLARVTPSAAFGPPETSTAADAMAQGGSPAMLDYRRRWAEYQQIHGAFEAEASAYWAAIADKRRGRNAKRRDHQPIDLDDYVLTQPPVYAGPKRPVSPVPEPEPER